MSKKISTFPREECGRIAKLAQIKQIIIIKKKIKRGYLVAQTQRPKKNTGRNIMKRIKLNLLNIVKRLENAIQTISKIISGPRKKKMEVAVSLPPQIKQTFYERTEKTS